VGDPPGDRRGLELREALDVGDGRPQLLGDRRAGPAAAEHRGQLAQVPEVLRGWGRAAHSRGPWPGARLCCQQSNLPLCMAWAGPAEVQALISQPFLLLQVRPHADHDCGA